MPALCWNFNSKFDPTWCNCLWDRWTMWFLGLPRFQCRTLINRCLSLMVNNFTLLWWKLLCHNRCTYTQCSKPKIFIAFFSHWKVFLYKIWKCYNKNFLNCCIKTKVFMCRCTKWFLEGSQISSSHGKSVGEVFCIGTSDEKRNHWRSNPSTELQTTQF